MFIVRNSNQEVIAITTRKEDALVFLFGKDGLGCTAEDTSPKKGFLAPLEVDI
tara:strand:- start:87 stop:245 length:159 start_codon:yes stop_codon:yes gene_type:complete